MRLKQVVILGCIAALTTGPGAAEWNYGLYADVLAEKQRRRDNVQNRVFQNYPAPGKTYLTYGFGVGYMVRYYGEDGVRYSWPIGDTTIAIESWEKKKGRVCVGRVSPETKSDAIGGEVECADRVEMRRLAVGFIDGDAFGLSGGRAPFARKWCDAPDRFEIMAGYSKSSPVEDCGADPIAKRP